MDDHDTGAPPAGAPPRPGGRRPRRGALPGGSHALPAAVGGRLLPADDPAERAALLSRVLVFRAVASTVVGAAVALTPAFGEHRVAVGAALVASGVVGAAAVGVRVRAGHGVPAASAVADALITMGVVAVAPATYPVLLLVPAALVGLGVFWYGPAFSAVSGCTTAIGLLALGVVLDPPLWAPAYATWLVTMVFAWGMYARLAGAAESVRRRYDELVNGIEAAVWEAHGPAGPPDFISDYVEELLGYPPEELLDDAFLRSRVHPEDLPALLAARRQVARGHDADVHFRVRDAAGRTRRLHERVRVALGPDGEVARRRGLLVDETRRWEDEETIRRYADLIEGVPIALVILRLDEPEDPRSLRVLAANPAAKHLVRLDADDATGRRVVDVAPLDDEFLARVADVVRLDQSMEQPFLHLPGIEETLALRAVPLPDRCVGVSVEDVSKRARLAESFRHQALHDPLTGLPNRALLNERLGTALEEARRSDEPVALLMIDLDRFKEVNDALGHEYGDRLLVELARRVGRHLRHCDTIARLGGDEFAILLTTGADEAGALEVAHRLLDLCEQPFQVDDYRLQVSASVGIALAPEHATTADVLLRRADGAMYRAKGSGGGAAVYAPGQDQANVRRLELLADLREAVDSDALVVHYQPRVELASMRTVGVEALVRWHHPRHGLLGPGEFIELAEVSGAIRRLTRAVTHRAVGDLAALHASSWLSLSVNVSVRNLYDPTLVEWVQGVLDGSGLPPGGLCFELTESQLMDDPSVALEVLEQLRAAGVRLSVDDFGTGYSSLAYLRDLPIDEVKIDKRFVADLERGDDGIVRSVVDLGHNLGLHVVAEGVEQPGVLQRLRELGCDSVQGYLLARPMPVEELARHLGTGPAAPWERPVTRR